MHNSCGKLCEECGKPLVINRYWACLHSAVEKNGKGKKRAPSGGGNAARVYTYPLHIHFPAGEKVVPSRKKTDKAKAAAHRPDETL